MGKEIHRKKNSWDKTSRAFGIIEKQIKNPNSSGSCVEFGVGRGVKSVQSLCMEGERAGMLYNNKIK